MGRGFLKLMVAGVLAMLSLIPVVGPVFLVLSGLWVLWAAFLIVTGLIDYIKEISDPDHEAPNYDMVDAPSHKGGAG